MVQKSGVQSFSPRMSGWIRKYEKARPKPGPKNLIQSKVETIQPPNELNAVFLLELSDGTLKISDNLLKTTIEYYWNNYPAEFQKCPIVDTKGEQTILEEQLNKYYEAGYRNFIGFSAALVLKQSLDWFNNHPDAIGISTKAGTKDLNHNPKNIYRTTNSDDIRITPIIPFIKNKTIYYIYENGLPNPELTNVDLQNMKTKGEIVNVFSYKLDITLDNMKTFLSNAKPDDVIINYLFNSRDKFINCFSKNIYGDNRLQIQCTQYDINGSEPNIPIYCQDILNEKYRILTFDGIGSSILYRNGDKDLGVNFFSDGLRVLNMLITIKNNESVGCCTSHFGVIEFDPVTKTILYNNSTIKQLKDGVFDPIYLYVEDPYVGTYEAIFTGKQQIPQEIIPMNPLYISGKAKAIAFFELNNPNFNFDNIFNYSLYWYCYQRQLYPKMPIITTDNTVEGNIRLLNQYYFLGYRIFLGFSRSTILEGVNDWFTNHPDTIALSCFSTSVSPTLLERKNTNVFRLEYNDNCIVDSILPQITENKYTKLYYIYSGNENAAINLKKYLENYINSQSNITYIPYNIDESDNYSLTKLQGLFNDSNEKSAAILYIFDEQNYFDLFSQGLKFPGKQYSILNESTPIIKGDAIAELDNKLYYILTFSANSSKIWRDNATYLSKQFNTETNSASLGDAIKMIQYMLKGRPTNLLGSHCGPIQFNKNGDRLFASYLKLLYNGKTNTFEKSNVIISDPLLGIFKADL
jgi:hypothetical protein